MLLEASRGKQVLDLQRVHRGDWRVVSKKAIILILTDPQVVSLDRSFGPGMALEMKGWKLSISPL